MGIGSPCAAAGNLGERGAGLPTDVPEGTRNKDIAAGIGGNPSHAMRKGLPKAAGIGVRIPRCVRCTRPGYGNLGDICARVPADVVEVSPDIDVWAKRIQSDCADPAVGIRIPRGVRGARSAERELGKPRATQPTNIVEASADQNVAGAVEHQGAHNAVGTRIPRRIEAAIAVNARDVVVSPKGNPPGKVAAPVGLAPGRARLPAPQPPVARWEGGGRIGGERRPTQPPQPKQNKTDPRGTSGPPAEAPALRLYNLPRGGSAPPPRVSPETDSGFR